MSNARKLADNLPEKDSLEIGTLLLTEILKSGREIPQLIPLIILTTL